MTTLAPTAPIYCLDCGKPLTRWDSRHRRRGQVCQDRVDHRPLVDDDEIDEHDEEDSA